MNRSLIILIFSNFIICSDALAHHQHAHSHRHNTAKVISVVSVYEQVAVRHPERHCWNKTVPSKPRRHSKVGTLVGGLIGANIGRKLGHNRHSKNAAMVTGAIVGASIGHSISHRNQRRPSEYRTQQHCTVKQRTEYEEQLMGYDVSYRYHGKIYHILMAEHPGRRIRVDHIVHTSF